MHKCIHKPPASTACNVGTLLVTDIDLQDPECIILFHFAEDQNRQTGSEALLHSVVLRLGALLVLMLTVGDWSDVLHILIAFLGEAACLLPSQDLLRATLKVCVNHLFLLLCSFTS